MAINWQRHNDPQLGCLLRAFVSAHIMGLAGKEADGTQRCHATGNGGNEAISHHPSCCPRLCFAASMRTSFGGSRLVPDGQEAR